jgi:glutathione S-transferase
MARPVLWQIKVSHYSEKVRWALDYKGVEHERKAPPPGPHVAFALFKTRGDSMTLPLLDLDGRTYGDSTDIIAALEERWPDPPLYPADPGERQRALELEDFFDEEVGPYTRLYAWHEITRDPDVAARVLEGELPSFAAPAARFLAPVAAAGLQLRYGVKSDDAAAEAREKIASGLDRLEAELGDRDYLAGDSFSVADLTAASLYYPIVLPPEAPSMPDPPAVYEEFRSGFAERPGFRYVQEMFRRHRKRNVSEPAVTAD